MFRSIIDLSEHLAEPLLWVQADGQVRHANRAARRRTALRAGDRLDDVMLERAALLVARTGQARAAALHLGDERLACQVLPGLSADDAFVLLTPPAEGPADGADRLLRAVDGGLRHPLRRATQALHLWRADTAEPHAAAALGTELEQLLHGVERLLDLGEIWTRPDIADDERIELWPLLQQAWSEIEPQALERRVGVRFRGTGVAAVQATLYGSRRWLARALSECLAAGVAATPDDGQLEVEQQQLGDRARVLFRAPTLFAGAEAGGTSAVALQLCRMVMALHGGALTADEDGWALTLPTGAPARPEEPALGIVQAQVYARDLAALMNRSRERGAEAN